MVATSLSVEKNLTRGRGFLSLAFLLIRDCNDRVTPTEQRPMILQTLCFTVVGVSFGFA